MLQFLPPSLQQLPAEDWRFLGAAGLVMVGAAGLVLGVRKIRAIPFRLGDPDCPIEAYLAAFKAKGWKEDRARRAWLYQPLIVGSAKHFGVPPALMMGLIHTESGFQPSAGSSAGAVGLGQQMPNTALGRFRQLYDAGEWPFQPLTENNDPAIDRFLKEQAKDPSRVPNAVSHLDRTRPEQSAWMAAAGMAIRMRSLDMEHALANYNAGSKIKQHTPTHEWPQETQSYVPAVLRRASFWDNFFADCRGYA